MAIISSRPSIALAKTRWRNKGARTIAERAGVIGANVWKIATGIFQHMEKEGFRFGSDQQVMTVLGEFITFLVQLVDRAVYGKLGESDRAALIHAIAEHLATTVANNQLDLRGPGEYRKPFIDLLNARSEEYSRFEYSGGEPGYPCLSFFAAKVSEAMAVTDNKWVIEQMMDIEAPEMVRLMAKLVHDTTTDIAPG